MTLEEHAIAAIVAAFAGIALVILAVVAGHVHTASPATVKPYSYTTTVQGMTCTMDVDSNGNGSLNNCRNAS